MILILRLGQMMTLGQIEYNPVNGHGAAVGFLGVGDIDLAIVD